MSAKPQKDHVHLLMRWTMVLGVLVVTLSMAGGKFGISNYFELKKRKQLLMENNAKISLSNQLLLEKMALLQKNKLAAARHLKQTYGVAEKNDIVFIFSNKSARSRQRAAPQSNSSLVAEVALKPLETRSLTTAYLPLKTSQE